MQFTLNLDKHFIYAVRKAPLTRKPGTMSDITLTRCKRYALVVTSKMILLRSCCATSLEKYNCV